MDKMKLALMTIIWAAVLLQDTYGEHCPSDQGWLMFENHCYRFVAFPRLDPKAAQGTCRMDGATLVSVNTLDEHEFISGWLFANDVNRNSWLTSGLADPRGVTWTGDSTASFTPWPNAVGSSSSSSNNLVYSFQGTNYIWAVDKAETAYSFICEISANEVHKIVHGRRDFDYGTSIENASLAPKGPRFLEQPQDTFVSGNPSLASIQCLSGGNPEPSYNWLSRRRNDRPMNPEITLDDRFSLRNGTLEIMYPERVDENNYYCSASNKFGTILSDSIVLSFGEIGQFSNVPPTATYVREYDGTYLECPQISYDPAITCVWRKNELQMVRPEFQIHMFVSASGRLFSSELTMSDTGIYYCICTLSPPEHSRAFGNLETRTSLGIPLNVAQAGIEVFPLEIPSYFIYTFPATPMRGGTVGLECFSYGTGPLEYSWSRVDGKPLPSGHQLQSNNRILMLHGLELEDGGDYTCKVISTVTNETASRTTNLILQAKPFFTFPLSNQHLDVGNSLVWHCEVEGVPSPTNTWYKNGQALSSSQGVTVSGNTLTIDSVETDRDSGMYQCAGTNVHGTVFSTAQLRVLEFEPNFKRSAMPKVITAPLGGTVTLDCNPQAAPRPNFVWFWNGIDLELTPSTFNSQNRDHFILLANGSLVIQDLRRTDAARFSCKVENALGSASDYTNIDLRDGPIRIDPWPISSGSSILSLSLPTGLLFCAITFISRR